MQAELDALGITAEKYLAVQSHKMPKNCCVTPAANAHGTPAANAHGMQAPRGRSSSRGRAAGHKSENTSRAGSVNRSLTKLQMIKTRYDSAVLKYKNMGGIAGIVYNRVDLLAKAYELVETGNTKPVLEALLDHMPAQPYYEKAKTDFPLTYLHHEKPLAMKTVTAFMRYKNLVGRSLKDLHDQHYAWDKNMSKFTLAALLIQRDLSVSLNKMELVEFLTSHTTPTEEARNIAQEHFPKYSKTTENYEYRTFSRHTIPHSHASHAPDTMPHARAPHAPEHYPEQDPDSLLGPDASQNASSYESRYIAEQVPDEYRV